MALVTASELAQKLQVSKGRVSQYVKQGKLDGCFEGDGRHRRFDLAKVAGALGRRLDQGQMLGNGAATRSSLENLDAGSAPPARGAGAERLPDGDDDRYKMARTLKTEEEARRLRKNNAIDDGAYVLASQATLQTKRLVAQEVAEFEKVLRDGARKIADDLGVDFKAARALLIQAWRAHRDRRTRLIQSEAKTATMTDEEKAKDI